MEITWRVITREGEGDMGEKIEGITNINGRHTIDKRRLKIASEMERPNNLYV